MDLDGLAALLRGADLFSHWDDGDLAEDLLERAVRALDPGPAQAA